MSSACCCSFLYCGKKRGVLDDHCLRQGRSIFEANLFTLVGPLRLRNLTVGPADGVSISLQDVQGGRGELDRDEVSGRASTVEVIPLPEWRHDELTQIESSVEEAVQSFADRRGSVVRLNDLVKVVGANESQLIGNEPNVSNRGPGPGEPKGTNH